MWLVILLLLSVVFIILATTKLRLHPFLVLLISAALMLIITLGGWERLQSPSVGLLTIFWAAIYVLFAYLVMRWSRGILPVAASLAVIMVIFAAVAAPGWFDRRATTAALVGGAGIAAVTIVLLFTAPRHVRPASR